MKKVLLALFLVYCSVCLAGCQTLKSAAKGTGDALYTTGQGISKDWSNLCRYLGYTDEWFKENAW